MSDEAKVRALLEPLLDRPVDLAGTEVEVDRDRIAQAILRAGQQGRVASKPSGQLGWFLVAAAGLLLVGGAAALWRLQQPSLASSQPARTPSHSRAEPAFIVEKIRGSVTRSEGGVTQILQASAQTPRMTLAGELWTGPSSGADLRSGEGLRIELFDNTRVSLAGLHAGLAVSTLELLAGRIQCRATAPAGAGGFSLITPDAVVRVQAALFSVDVGPQGPNGKSCVRVETGQVVVVVAGDEQLLHAGSTWGCDASQPAEPAVPSSASPAKPAKPREAGTTLPPAPSGTLDQENRLFQAGLSSERSGQAEAAAESFRALVKQYPKSPLAGEAKRALERVTRAPGTR